MFRYHPNFKFIQLHKTLSDLIEEGSDIHLLKTDDGILIRKLYIKLLNKSVGDEEIYHLLSVFGVIESLEMFHCKRLRHRGFVTFKESSSASCALINRKKFSEVFELSPADTWNQPELNVTAKQEIVLSQKESLLLEMLNDDSLLHIMRFLDLPELLTLSEVCRKMLELCEIHFRTIRKFDFSEIKSKKKLTAHESRQIMMAIGDTVVKISITSEKFHDQRVLNFIPRYLLNLKYLRLSGFKLNLITFWDQMSFILSKLEALDLSDNSEINESFLKSFKKNKSNLKTLNVANCIINGKFLKDVSTIESLNISGCRNINGLNLIGFAEVNQNLKSLDISKCANLDGKVVNELLGKLPQLEVLTIDNYYIDQDTSIFVIPNINPLIKLKELTINNFNNPPCDQLLRTIFLDNRIEILNISYGNLTLTTMYAISTMKHLKKLLMNFKNSVRENFVDILLDLKTLQELHISGCSYISPRAALRLFLLPSLKFIDISRCYDFTNNFITEAVEVLSQRDLNRRVSIRVGQTEIDQNILMSDNVTKSLDLHWKITKDVEHDVDYDIDEGSNRQENSNEKEYFSIDDIINILSNIQDYDVRLVAAIKDSLS